MKRRYILRCSPNDIINFQHFYFSSNKIKSNRLSNNNEALACNNDMTFKHIGMRAQNRVFICTLSSVLVHDFLCITWSLGYLGMLTH